MPINLTAIMLLLLTCCSVSINSKTQEVIKFTFGKYVYLIICQPVSSHGIGGVDYFSHLEIESFNM